MHERASKIEKKEIGDSNVSATRERSGSSVSNLNNGLNCCHSPAAAIFGLMIARATSAILTGLHVMRMGTSASRSRYATYVVL